MNLILLLLMFVFCCFSGVACGGEEKSFEIVDPLYQERDCTPAGLLAVSLSDLNATYTLGEVVVGEAESGEGWLNVKKLSDTEVSISLSCNVADVDIPYLEIPASGLPNGTCDNVAITLSGVGYSANSVAVGGYITDITVLEENGESPDRHTFECSLNLNCRVDDKPFTMKIWGQSVER